MCFLGSRGTRDLSVSVVMWCLGFVVSVERDSGEILTDSSLPGFGSGVGGSVGPVLMGFFFVSEF